MKGWIFVHLQQESTTGRIVPTVQGMILGEVAPGRFLCRLDQGLRTHSRVVSIDEMATWTLFETAREFGRFMQSLEPPPAAEAVPVLEAERGPPARRAGRNLETATPE